MRKYIAVALAVTLLISALCPLTAGADRLPCPTFSFKGLDGTVINNATLKGKTTLLIFFRTTCPNSIATIEQLSQTPWISQPDLNILAVELDGRPTEEIQAFAATHAGSTEYISFCTLGNSSLWEFLRTVGYSDNSVTLPVSFILDADGNIRDYATAFTAPYTYRYKLELYTSFTLTGDVDDSGVVDSTDARLVLQYAVKKITYLANEEAADVDKNGVVDSTDARLILQYAVKKIDVFPAA